MDLEEAITECKRLKELIYKFEKLHRTAPEYEQSIIQIAIEFLQNELSIVGLRAKKLSKEH